MTQNTETLKLYKHPLYYNGSRYKFYHNDRNYEESDLNDYLGYTKTVYYKSLSEPIVINEYIKDCDEYTYGSITNEGKTYYFFVDKITTDAYKQTTISYSIDWWSTKWNKLTCTKAHITRSSIKPGYMPQPFTPMNITASREQRLGDRGGVVLFSFLSSQNDDVQKYGVLDINSVSGLEYVEIGDWADAISDNTGGDDGHKVTAGDINAIFIVPLFSINDFINAGWKRVYGQQLTWYCSEKTGSSLAPEKVISFDEIGTTEIDVFGISDWNGNTVWECPYGVTVSKFKIKLMLSIQHAQIRFIYNDTYENENTGKGFTYECRQCAIIVDQAEEYTWREREAEYQTRRIQSAKQVWTNASDAIQGMGFGAAFGGSGPAIGAAVTGIGGAINTFSTWAMNEHFDPMFQEAQDYKYQRMQDLVSVYGDSITSIYTQKIGNTKIFVYDSYIVNNEDEFTLIYNTPTLLNTYIPEKFPNEEVSEGDKCVVVDYKRHNGEGNPPVQITRGDFSTRDGYGTVEYVPYVVRNYTYTFNGTNWERDDLTGERSDIKIIKLSTSSQSYTDAFTSIIGRAPSVGDIGYFMMRFDPLNPAQNNQRSWVPTTAYYDGESWINCINYIYDSSGGSYRTDKFIPISCNFIPLGQLYDNLMFIYKLTMDDYTKQRMLNDVNINGYYCDEITNDLQSRFGRNSVIQADNVTIQGACTLEAKQQVVYRLSRGVHFI